MKMIQTIKTIAATLLLGVFTLQITACSDDDTKPTPTVKEGVVFNFSRIKVYAMSASEIGSVKITLMDAQNQKITLPSLRVEGDEEHVKSQPYALKAGHYKLAAYTTYNRRGEYLTDFESESYDPKAEFDVTAETVTEFVVPFKVKEMMNMSFLRSSLIGLCREVFGDNEKEWPWNPDTYPYPDWEGLEFELDDYGSPMFLVSLVLHGQKDGVATPWSKMKEIPQGTISNIATIANITITDAPDFKHLPDDMNRLVQLRTINLINTGIEELPYNIDRIPTLTGILVVDSKLKTFPQDLSSLKEMRDIVLHGNEMTEFTTDLTGLSHLRVLNLNNNPSLATIGEKVFSNTSNLNSLKAAYTSLSTLPASLSTQKSLRSVELTGAKFTAIPSQLNQIPELKEIYLDENPLTSIKAEDLKGITALRHLSLSGSPIKTLPRLENNLMWLDIHNCQMKALPDMSAYPNLRYLDMGGNDFESLPEKYFEQNGLLRVLSLSDSKQLKTLPQDLGLKVIIKTTLPRRQALKVMSVENCPQLKWTTPAGWNCFDWDKDNSHVFPPHGIDKVPPMDEKDPIVDDDYNDEMFGRVGIIRTGSANVVFGN